MLSCAGSSIKDIPPNIHTTYTIYTYMHTHIYTHTHIYVFILVCIIDYYEVMTYYDVIFSHSFRTTTSLPTKTTSTGIRLGRLQLSC